MKKEQLLDRIETLRDKVKYNEVRTLGEVEDELTEIIEECEE